MKLLDMTQSKQQTGFSMVEMLVTLLVLAIGLLGQMALQMTSIASNQSSYYRSQAIVVANQFAERMRANPDGAENNAYDNVDVDSTSNVSRPGCYNQGCRSSDQALVDIYDLQKQLLIGIPSGSVTVVRDAGVDGSVFNITVSWEIEDRVGLTNGANVNRFTMDFRI